MTKTPQGRSRGLRLVPPVHRATHAVATYLDSAHRTDVSQAEAHLLTHLISAGPSTVADLHTAFGHRRSTLTSILDRLELRGMITRQTSADDRRTFVVALTRSGRTSARAALSLLLDLEDAVASRVSMDDVEAFLRVTGVLAEIGHTRSSDPGSANQPRRRR